MCCFLQRMLISLRGNSTWEILLVVVKLSLFQIDSRREDATTDSICWVVRGLYLCKCLYVMVCVEMVKSLVCAPMDLYRIVWWYWRCMLMKCDKLLPYVNGCFVEIESWTVFGVEIVTWCCYWKIVNVLRCALFGGYKNGVSRCDIIGDILMGCKNGDACLFWFLLVMIVFSCSGWFVEGIFKYLDIVVARIMLS